MTVARSSGRAMAAAWSRSTGDRRDPLVPVQDAVGGPAVVVDDGDVFEAGQLVAHLEDPLEEAGVFDDGGHGAGVLDQVLDLLRWRRVVDRDRGRTDEQGGDVGDVELGPVAHHQHHPVAALHAQVGERRRDPTGPVGVLGPGPLAPAVAVLPAQRHLVGPGPHGVAEVARDRLSGHRLGDVLGRHLRHDHDPPLSRGSLACGSRPRAARSPLDHGRLLPPLLHRVRWRSGGTGVENLWKMVDTDPGSSRGGRWGARQPGRDLYAKPSSGRVAPDGRAGTGDQNRSAKQRCSIGPRTSSP